MVCDELEGRLRTRSGWVLSCGALRLIHGSEVWLKRPEEVSVWPARRDWHVDLADLAQHFAHRLCRIVAHVWIPVGHLLAHRRVVNTQAQVLRRLRPHRTLVVVGRVKDFLHLRQIAAAEQAAACLAQRLSGVWHVGRVDA
eukprot:5709283-Prymnesium_polylepis.2